MTIPFMGQKAIYKPFTIEEINQKIVEILRPEGMTTPVELVFQSIEGLHNAIPNHPGLLHRRVDLPEPAQVRVAIRDRIIVVAG